MNEIAKAMEACKETLRSARPTDEVGIWQIMGADQNTDLGGSHAVAQLAIASGTYGQAVEWAIAQQGFWSWGSPGEVRPFAILDLEAMRD